MAVSSARALIDARAAPKASSTVAPKRFVTARSEVKAWTVRIAPMASEA